MCNGVFESDWSDEEAKQELKENFGDNCLKKYCNIVCDDCYNILIKEIKCA